MVDVCSFIVKLFLQHGILLHGSIPVSVNCYLPHVNVNNEEEFLLRFSCSSVTLWLTDLVKTFKI